MKKIEIFKDESAQTSAEYILIFGGIIVIVLVAIISYQNYVKGVGADITNGSEMSSLNSNLTQINNTLNGL
ncbi:MAG: class III signal peptide-containing protein [Methanobacteriaceae archaeon]|nr:class III signal peptide-containing protein [Methanobacteriaceae archaeon]